MSTNKAIQYLTTFLESDWKAMNKYARIHFTQGSELDLLYSFLKKEKTKIADGKIELSKIQRILKNSTDKKAFQNLLSVFGTHIETYFVQEEMKSNPFNDNYFLLQALRKRGHHKQYDSLAHKMKSNIEDSKIDFWNELRLLQIEHDQYLSNSPNKIKNGKNILTNKISHLLKFTSQLSSFYICETYNRDRQTSEIWDDEISILKKTTLPNSKLSAIFESLYRVQKGSKSEFIKLLKWLQSKKNNSTKEIKLICLLYLNNNIPNLYTTHNSRANYAIKIIEIGLQQKLYEGNGIMPVVRYHNIIDILCFYGRFELATQIAKDYKSHLEGSIQDEALALANAQILFKNESLNKGKEKALEILRNHNFIDIKLSPRSRGIILCCLLDLNPEKTELLKSQSEAFRLLINRHKSKLSDIEYLSYKNLHKSINLLIRNKIKELETLSQSKEIIFFKSYIIDKTKERLSSIK